MQHDMAGGFKFLLEHETVNKKSDISKFDEKLEMFFAHVAKSKVYFNLISQIKKYFKDY